MKNTPDWQEEKNMNEKTRFLSTFMIATEMQKQKFVYIGLNHVEEALTPKIAYIVSDFSQRNVLPNKTALR